MKWMPWETYKDTTAVERALAIAEIIEPPCKNCAYFKPTRKVSYKGEFDGVSICTASDMFNDFSCYVWVPEGIKL